MESAEERRRKLEAGRAKLAHFRQRKAKNDSPHSQKKTSKRKNTSVHSHDLPTQERTLDSESNVRLQELVSSETADITQQDMGASHQSQPSAKTDQVDAAVDTSQESDSLSITTGLLDSEVNPSFLEHYTFSDDLELSDAEVDASHHNLTFSEDIELAEGEMDVTLQNESFPANIDCTVPDTHVDFQNQTLDTNDELTDPDMGNGVLKMFSGLTDMQMETTVEQPIPNMVTRRLDTSLCNLEETELEEGLLETSDLENNSGEEQEDTQEQLCQQVGCQDGEKLLELYLKQTVTHEQQDLEGVTNDLQDHKEVDVAQQIIPHEDNLQKHLAAISSQNGGDWPEECFRQPGTREEECVLEQHAAQGILQELESAVHERNTIIYRLSSNLQQALQSRDEFQGEAMLLASQFQAVQQRMKEATEFLKSNNPPKPDVSKSQQQIAVFQSNLREQTTRLQMLGVKARELEQQLEFSEKATKDKECLLAKMEETLKGTEDSMHHLNKGMVVKEQTIQDLQDELARANQNANVLQQALSLCEQEVMDLKNEIASVRQKEKSSFEDHVTFRCDKLQHHSVLCRGDTKEVLRMREALDEELHVKPSVEFCPVCSDRNIEGLNFLINDLNHKLGESENICENLHRALEKQMQEFSRERSATEQRHNSLMDDLKLQLKHAEDQTQEVLLLKHEKERLNSDVQALQAKLHLESENVETLRCRLNEETKECALKLQDLILEKETCCDEFVRSHAADLERIQGELSLRYESELHLLRQMLAHQPGFRQVTVQNEVANLKKSLDKVNSSNVHESHESTNILGEVETDLLDHFLEDCEMAKYLAPTGMRDHSGTTEKSLEQFDCDQSSRDGLEFYGDVTEPSLNSTVNFEPFYSPLPIMNMLGEGAAHSVKLDAVSFAVYLSRNIFPSAQLNDSCEHLDENACLIERCLILTKQLDEKEKEVTLSSEALRDAQEKCIVLTDALSAAQEELQGKDVGHKVSSVEKLQDQSGSGMSVISLDLQTQGSDGLVLQDTIKKLQHERDILVVQLREQERLLKDVKVQKGASGSVNCEMQPLVGYQLTGLPSQQDQLNAEQLVTSDVLEQNNILEQSLRKEKTPFNSVIFSKEETVACLANEESILEEALCSVQQCLEEAEQALEKRNMDKERLEQERLEQDIAELHVRIKDLQKELELAKVELNFQLHAKELAREDLRKEMLEKEREFSLREQELANEVDRLKVIHKDLERSLEEMRGRCEAETRRLVDLQMDYVRVQHQMEVLQEEHTLEVEQLVDIHKQEIENMHAALTKEQQLLLDKLKSQAEESHNAEVQQAQTLHHLEMEALRLSLTNMHTAHLELSQSNLHKERETALVELREMLNGKRAQEVALLQSRHQFEVEHIREQQGKEIEALTSNHQREIDTIKQKYEMELSTQLDEKLQAQRRAWGAETEELLKDLNAQLSDAHQLETSLQAQLVEREDEVARLTLEREQSMVMLENVQNKHQSETKDLHEKIEVQYTKQLDALKQEAKVMEDDLRQQIAKLLVDYEELKTLSEQEIKQLWSQLDSTRTSRQELSELREQLLTRTSHVAEIERVKQDFELQRQQLKGAHETELEQLRIYFEQKLRGTEENYREELTLLHLRLREVKDDSVEENLIDLSSSALSDETLENRNHELLEQLAQQLEQHKEELLDVRYQAEERHRHELESMRSLLALQYKEDLLNLKLDLSDRYICEIETLKNKHCLELEQLRAQLSGQHIKEITKMHLLSTKDSTRQVEAEVSARIKLMEGEHQAQLALLKSEKPHAALREEHTEQMESNCNALGYGPCVHQKSSLQGNLEHVICLVEGCRQDVEEAEVGDAEVQPEHQAEDTEQQLSGVKQIGQGDADSPIKQICVEVSPQKRERLDLPEVEIKLLQEQQAARILELEKLVKEQQNSLHQMEDMLAKQHSAQTELCTHHEQELSAAKVAMGKELEEATQCLREESASKLKEAELRYMEKQKDLLEELSHQHKATLQELRQKHLLELKCLQEQMGHFPEELLTEHLAETQVLRDELETQQQAQVDERLAELQAAHEAQIAELEARHLSNMDTLESSYLSEIQTIRDEHRRSVQDLEVHISNRLLEKEEETVWRLVSENERLQAEHEQELQLAMEELRKELDARQKNALSAKADELEAAYQELLNESLQSQKRALETDHHKALDILRAEVLKMEEQHKSALHELQDLHLADVQQQKTNNSKQLQQLKCQHEEQLKLCTAEAETLRLTHAAQLDEKSKQLLVLQEEMNALKCQSERLLEQQISQLKAEFEEERKSLLDEKEQIDHKVGSERSIYQREREQLTQQIKAKTDVVIQLEEKVSTLNKKMEESHLQLETLVQRRERENQECENLVAMLRSDASSARTSQKSWQDSYQRAMKLFTEMVKSTIATEDLISRKVGLCLDDSLACGGAQNMATPIGAVGNTKDIAEDDNSDWLLDSPDHSLASTLTDEGYDLSEHLCESLFGSPELLAESEGRILKISHRLRTAVERLLELVTDSTKQLEKTHEVQAHFEEEFNRRNQETAQVVRQHQELLQRLNEESDGKQQLVLELHKARGVIEGYAAEKATLEEALNEKEDSRRSVIIELEKLREEFQMLTQAQLLLAEEREVMQRQKTALNSDTSGAGDDLLKQLECLSQEKLELKCQSEKDRSNLISQMNVLEAELEEQMSRNQELAQKNSEVYDLRQQIQVLEKQLKNQRHFMDEQAVEREHERDDFQQEIQRLEAQLKSTAKSQSISEGKGYGLQDLNLQVDFLQASVKEKADGYNLLLLGKEELEREIVEQNEDIEKMAARIQQLEQAVLVSAESEKKCTQLEQELAQMKKVEMELLQDRESLEKQRYSNAMQISSLKSKLDEARHRYPADGDSAHVLKEQLQAEHEALLTKEKEVESLAEQLEQFREELMNKTEETLQLHMQLEVQKKQSDVNMQHLQDENNLLKEDLSCLRGRLHLDSEGKTSSLLEFPHILLEEKNQEIDHLNEQLQRLQQELKRSANKQAVDHENTNLEELKSSIERLQGDQERLRQDKEEEVEQLHEVIEKLQQELALLGPIRHEVSDSQDNLNELGFGAAENLQDELRKGSQEPIEHHLQREREASASALKALQEELDQVHITRENQQQMLEEKESEHRNEVNIVKQNLHNVQESSRQQFHELESLRLQYSTLQEEYDLLRDHLLKKDAETDLISSRVQELEDMLREKEATLIERELQLKTLEEQRLSEQTDSECLTGKVAELEAELLKTNLLLGTETEQVKSLRTEALKHDLLLQDLYRKEENYCKEIHRLQADSASVEAKMHADSTELEALCSFREQLEAVLPTHKDKDNGLIEEISELQRKLAERESEVQTLSKKLEEWKPTTNNPISETEALGNLMLQGKLSSAEGTTRLGTEGSLPQVDVVREEQQADMDEAEQELLFSEERNKHILQQLGEKEVTVVDMKTHSENLKTQIKQLQEILLHQESEIESKNEELAHLKQEMHKLQGCLVPLKRGIGSFSQLVDPSEDGHRGFTDRLIDLSSWSSPELARKQDSSIEHLHSLHGATPFSEISAARSADLGIAADKSGFQGDTFDLLGYQSLFANKNQHGLEFRTSSFSRSRYSTIESPTCNKDRKVDDDAAFSFTPLDSQEDLRSSSSMPDAVFECGSHASLESASMLDQELEGAEYQNTDVITYPEHGEMTEEGFDLKTGEDFSRKRKLSPKLQAMLTMVHEESCKILALSEHPLPVNAIPVSPHQCIPSESWQKDRKTLMDTMESLKNLIAKSAHRAEDLSDQRSDWRGELLIAIQRLFEKQHESLCTELQSLVSRHASGDGGSLLEKLEHIVKEQEEQQQLVLEHLLSSDRSSLLSEIQDLRAQLRMTHLQNQEKLQQLQESITNAEDHGSKQEHKLGRQIELLEYKLQQETSIAGDLQTSLSREQERAFELRKHLGEERETTSQLRLELAQSKQEVERLLLSQRDLQTVIARLSSTLKDKEKDVAAAQQTLEIECEKLEQQQALWEQEQVQLRLREDQNVRTIQELENALEEMDTQKKQLSVALEHEQASVSNLRKELQIEQSRCEALLSQERGKMLEMQHILELEKTRSAELSSTLQHERALLEQFNGRQTGEDFYRQQREALLEHSLVLDLQAELEGERQRAVELAAMLEKTQQQAIQSKRHLEVELHLHQEEYQKEKEVSTKLRATMESLKNQKQEVLTLLEAQRARELSLQSERDQLESRLLSMREQERSKQEERDKEKQREQQADTEKEKQWERDREILQELQRQHQRDELRIKELQQTLAEIEEQERNLVSRKRQKANSFSPLKDPINPSHSALPDNGAVFFQQLQKMEKMRQQLLSAAVHLKEFGRNVSDRSFTEYSDEEALTSLLKMLTELKMELQRLSSLPQNPVQGSTSLTDVLMVENDELTKSVIMLTEEKLGLKREISSLEKGLAHHLHRGTQHEQISSVDASDPAPDMVRINWQREKIILQNALKQSEAELAKVIAGIENRPVSEISNSKLHRLYRKYLRAESFRKALVYQKKYLLLLLGGFQDCEQATLSMIARMGVYPSPVDLEVVSTHSHAFTKFRSTVRAVIAISRLKFLVKKWQKVHKKGNLMAPQAQLTQANPAFGIRPEVLRHSGILNSPPTREQTLCHRSNSVTAPILSPKSPYYLHNSSQTTPPASPNQSWTAMPEPEGSLMDYIHHLEVLQHRLGGMQQGGSPGKCQDRNTKK